MWNGFGGAAGIFFQPISCFRRFYPVPAGAFPGIRIRMGTFLAGLSFGPKPSGLPGGGIAFLPRVPLYAPFPLVLAHMHDMVVVRQGKME